jgi:23S rRNA (cytidine2498-2'-O)-methyltransferase
MSEPEHEDGARLPKSASSCSPSLGPHPRLAFTLPSSSPSLGPHPPLILTPPASEPTGDTRPGAAYKQAMTMRAYLAPEGFGAELLTELGARVRAVHGRLVLAETDADPDTDRAATANPGGDNAIREPAWVANIWQDPVEIPIRSIGDGARKLRAIQRNWALYATGHHRRAALIAAQLPPVSAKPLVFGADLPMSPLGGWTLLRPDMILASARTSSPMPHGEIRFIEDRKGPPSRAYLKLWEALTVAGARPGPGSVCLDLGASPGGWTWVLATLGARVISVDKAPLDAAVAAMAGVEVRNESAFGLDPRTLPEAEWVFSDVICYPARLLALVERWLALGRASRFVCTLKFQGETDFATAERFRAIPGSRLVHLHHNKHELTWIKV